MKATDKLSEQQVIKVKNAIKNRIALYLLNNKNEKKVSTEHDFVLEIIEIGVLFNLLETRSDALEYYLLKQCDSILSKNKSIDDMTEEIYSSFSDFNPLEAAIELSLDSISQAESELDEHDWGELEQ